LIHALDILDQVIKTIRSSKDKKDAKKNLIAKYEFTPNQAEAIVSLQLYRLTNTDVNQLKKEQTELNKKIDKFNEILSDNKVLEKVVVKELNAVKKNLVQPKKN
jgi:topoisomerase-4 subunit A